MINKEQIIQALSQIHDPEIPVNIYDLGLIYNVDVQEYKVIITMTLTAPNCPVAESLPMEIKNKILTLPEVDSVDVVITFDPPWSMDNLSDAAKLDLGLL